jgi:hypothetical protein
MGHSMADDEKKKDATNWVDNSGYTHVELYPDGSYKSFVPEIDTEWMIAKSQVKLRAGDAVKFFPDGTMKSCVLCEEATLDAYGVMAHVKANAPLDFHVSGKVRTLTLAAHSSWNPWAKKKKWSYKGTLYDPPVTLEFSEDGEVVRCTS